jgi:hypothetical protein
VRDDPDAAASGHHGKVAVSVGTQDPRPAVRELVEQPGIRVPVRVADAHADQRHPGCHRIDECEVLCGGPVMRHLQHVGSQLVAGDGEQVALLIRLRVAHEQHPGWPGVGAQHQRVVVRVRVGAGQLVDRTERGERQSGPGDPPPRRGPYGGDVAQLGVDGGGPVGRLVQRGQRDRGDLATTQYARQPVDVVGVEVAQDEQVHPVDAQPAQASVHAGRIGAGVDDDRAAGAERQDDGVALAHVAHDHERAGRRPARREHPHRQPAEDHADRDDEREPPRQPPPRGHEQRQSEGPEQQPAGQPVGPRQGAGRQDGPAVGDGDEPPGGPARQPGQELREGGRHRRHDGREDAEERRRCHRGNRQHVGRHGDGAHGARQRGDDGAAGDLGGRRDGQRLSERAGHASGAQPVAPAGREQDQTARGQRRQCEPRVARQVRIDEHEDEHGGRQRGRRGLPASRTQRQQRHGAHRRRPQHARRRPGQDHEADQHQRAHRHAQPRPRPQPPAHGQHHRQDHGNVGAGNGHEVGETGRAELLGQRRV